MISSVNAKHAAKAEAGTIENGAFGELGNGAGDGGYARSQCQGFVEHAVCRESLVDKAQTLKLLGGRRRAGQDEFHGLMRRELAKRSRW